MQGKPAARQRECLQRAVAALGGRALDILDRGLELCVAIANEQVLLRDLEHPLDKRVRISRHLTTA